MAITAGSLCVFMPLRYAASILAMLELILSTILAIALWTEVSKWSVDVGVRITGTSAAAASYYTILAFSALIGSFAIFVRARNVLNYFAFCLGWSLGLQLAISALQLWGYLSSPRSELMAACQNVPGMNEMSCSRAFSLSIGWLITSIIIGLLVQLCAAYVVSSYSSKLSDEEDYNEKIAGGNPNISAPQMLQTQPAPAPGMTLSRPSSHSRSDSQTAYEEYAQNTGKAWAASSRTSTDSERSGSDSDSDGEGHWSENERPPVPTLAPAPAPRRKRTRTPRVKPRYPEGTGPQSRDSEIVVNMPAQPEPTRANSNPFADPVLRPPPPAVLAQSSRQSTLVDSNSNASASSSKNTLTDAAKMV
ncbi:hypothetical protein PENSPDRAFT_656667 [Peniophora sp. CONT]|nr:hypothetical protein PENSPDRAFT_656667 [Peniophora sp. CONT]